MNIFIPHFSVLLAISFKSCHTSNVVGGFWSYSLYYMVTPLFDYNLLGTSYGSEKDRGSVKPQVPSREVGLYLNANRTENSQLHSKTDVVIEKNNKFT